MVATTRTVPLVAADSKDPSSSLSFLRWLQNDENDNVLYVGGRVVDIWGRAVKNATVQLWHDRRDDSESSLSTTMTYGTTAVDDRGSFVFRTTALPVSEGSDGDLFFRVWQEEQLLVTSTWIVSETTATTTLDGNYAVTTPQTCVDNDSSFSSSWFVTFTIVVNVDSERQGATEQLEETPNLIPPGLEFPVDIDQQDNDFLDPLQSQDPDDNHDTLPPPRVETILPQKKVFIRWNRKDKDDPVPPRGSTFYVRNKCGKGKVLVSWWRRRRSDQDDNEPPLELVAVPTEEEWQGCNLVRASSVTSRPPQLQKRGQKEEKYRWTLNRFEFGTLGGGILHLTTSDNDCRYQSKVVFLPDFRTQGKACVPDANAVFRRLVQLESWEECQNACRMEFPTCQTFWYHVVDKECVLYNQRLSRQGRRPPRDQEVCGQVKPCGDA